MGKKFEGKRVFLTGAASGVGKATLELFQAEGANVAGVDITEAEGLVWCDITDEAAVQQAMATAVDRLGGLDICLNVAGGEGGGLTGLEGVSLQTWNRALAVNLTGPMLVLKTALPHLRESKGNVVSVASISGIQGQPYLSAYCAAKAGLIRFMKSMAIELARDGIRVNCVSPGSIGLPSGADMMDLESTATIVDLPPMADDIDVNLLSRLNGELTGTTTQADIASAIAYLASDEARSISGANLLVDRVTLWSNP